MLTHGSLFHGIGGFALAARWCGIPTVWECEIDEYCRKLSKQNFPEIKTRYRDIRSIHEKNKPGYADIISASPPCQPFSTAGKRGGIQDDRHLWPETIRVFELVKPRWVICENVLGIASMAESRRILNVEVKKKERLPETDKYQAVLSYEEKMLVGSMLEDLEEIGYEPPRLTDGTPVIFCVPAIAVGAFHIRKRVWIIAYTSKKRLYSNPIQRSPHKKNNGAGRTGLPGLFCNKKQLKKKFSKDNREYDGLSRELVDAEIKAGGNAIVPQIALEIFRTIQGVEKKFSVP